MAAADRLYVELVANVGGFVTGMDRAATGVLKVDAASGRTEKALSKLQKGGLLALATGVGLAARETLKLDTAMRNVNSISGMTEGQLKATTSELVRMSADAKSGAQQASVLAEGLYDIASSGFQGAEGMQVLDAAAISASAGMTETAVSAKAITAVLNAYKKPAEEAADVSDVLFSTVNLGVVSFEQLAHNIGDYIGTAQALGVSFEETGAAIATMTLNGITATQSGTALNSVLAKLIKPGEGLQKVLKGMGYESGTAAIEALGLRGTLMAVTEATGGTAEGMSVAFDDINALRGALALTSGEGENYASVSDKITDKTERAGAAQRALAEQSKAASFQLGVLKNQAMAAGVEAANLVLPHVVTGLREMGEMGEAAGAGIGQLADAAGPALANLASIGEDLWDVFVDLADIVGPVAAGLGKLAVGAVLETLEALTGVLEPMVGLLAENEVVATALAIALGVHLVGGVAALVTRIQVGLVMALANALGAMGALTGGLAALQGALTSTAAVAAIATAGIAVALASVAVGFQRASAAADGLKRAQEAFDSAEGLQGQVRAMQDMAKASDQVLDRMEDLEGRSFLKTMVDLPGNIEALKMLASDTDEAALAMEQAALQAEVFRTHVNQLAESGFEPGSAAAMRFHNDVVLSGKAFEDMLPVLEAAGVKVGDSFEVMKMKVDAYKSSQNSAAGASDQMVTALDGISSGAKTTEDAVADLKSALDRLMGVFLSADQAAIEFESALDDMTDSVKENGTSLDINTRAGQANKSSIIGVVQALRDKIEADAAAGATGDELAATLRTGRDRLIEQAKAAGLPKKAMEELLAQYNLTPEMVKTIVEAVGTGAAKQELDAVKAAADRLDGKVAVVTTLYRSVGMPGAAPTSRTVGAGGGVREGDGGLLDFYANGGLRENHVAQIAPAGAWRVWAEDETGGEAYIPLAANKRARSIEIWKETGRRLDLYANGAVNGGRVSASDPRPLTAAVSGMTDVAQIHAVVRAWEAYNAQLEQAVRRQSLFDVLAQASANVKVATTTEQKTRTQREYNDARKALAEFDHAAAREREAAAVERQVEALRAQAEAEERAMEANRRAYEERRARQNNMHELGLIQTEAYLEILDRRLDDEIRYSDAWMAIWRERESILKEQTDAERDLTEALSDEVDKRLDDLNRLLDQEQDIRSKMAQSSEQFHEQQAELARDAATLERDYADDLVDLRDAQAKAEREHLERMARLAEDFTDEQTRILADRRDALANATALDQAIDFRRGLPADWLIRNAQRQVEALAEWMDELDLARRMGVSEAVIEALGLDDGPQALAQVRALTRASADEIDDLNRVVEERTRTAGEQVAREQLGNYGQVGQQLVAAQEQYASAVLAAQDVYRAGQERFAQDLLKLQSTFREAQQRLAAEQQALQEQFLAEQRSLAKEMAELGKEQGRSFGEALAEGLRSQIPAVLEAARALAEAMAARDAAARAANESTGVGNGPGRVRDATAAAKAAPGVAAPGAPPVGTAGSFMLNGQLIHVNKSGIIDTPGAWYGKYPMQVKTFDSGGWLQPGYTLAYNGTGRPERVTTASQDGGGRVVNVNVSGNVIRETVDADLLVQRAEFLISTGSMG